MGLETGDYIDDLVITNPLTSDAPSAGDDHLRFIKKTLKQSFPAITGAVTATQAELNILDGVTSTAAELNILDGVTADKDEINVLDGVTAGTVTASKALVVDASKDLSTINAATITTLTTTTIADGATATTQSLADGSTKLATTEYVDDTKATLPFTQSFVSSEQTISMGGALTLPHSLGAAPTLVFGYLVCKTAELGYSIGDKVAVSMNVSNDGSYPWGQAISWDATNVYITFTAGYAVVYTLINKATGVGGPMTVANWKFVVAAYK